MHTVGGYCEHGNPDNINELIAYGVSLGDVPVVLAADWNVTVDEGTASRSIASRRWHDAAALTGDDAERATTHSGANTRRRVDYFLVNNAARPLVRAVHLLEDHPLVNHYAVKLSLEVPDTEPEVDELALTRNYRKIENVPDAAGQLQEAWDQATRAYDDDAEPGPQHEKLWTRFCRLASAALETVLHEKPKGHQKGAPPVTRKRAHWAKPTPAGAANQHMLLPHRGLVLLRRLRQMLTQPAAEGRLLGVSRALNKILAQSNILKDGEFMTTETEGFQNIQQKLDKAAAGAAKLTKRARVEKWREKVGSSLRAACRWLRGGQANVDVLDGPAGERLVHPQSIAEEVRRRCCEQFATPQPQEEWQRAEFMKRFSHLMQNHPCELQPVQAGRLRHFVTRKRQGGAGLDGWQAIELHHLPRDAWQLLAEICQIAEDSSEWPDSWTVGLVAAPRKPNSTFTNVKLRMITIMSCLYRGWSSMRYEDLTEWPEKWMPKALYGGLTGKCTLQASIPIATAFSEAIVRKRQRIGVSLDFVSCFDRVFGKMGIEVLQAFGMHQGVATALAGLYKKLRRVCKVGAATTLTIIHNMISILQGCSLSVLMLNALVAAWAIFIATELTPTEREEAILSVFLDDRKVSMVTLELLQKILALTSEYDKLINTKLNQSKCQTYVVQLDPALANILPEAPQPEKPWSLGFALPTAKQQPANDDQAADKTQARVAAATTTAAKAAALPHEIRVRALGATFAQQYGYGAGFQPLTGHQQRVLPALRAALDKALLSGRTWRSAAVMWAVVFKGHALLPEKLRLLACCRFMHVLLHKCGAHWRTVFDYLWEHTHHRKRGIGVTPFHTLAALCHKTGWNWNEPTKIEAPDTIMGRGECIDLGDPNWSAVAHRARNHIRASILQGATFDKRWDMQGAESGLDLEKARVVINDRRRAGLDHYQLGTLRSILTGAVLTPARPRAAGQFTAEEAICCNCSLGALHTLGHALWQCPRWAHLRQPLSDFNQAEHPRCLTRCGLVPHHTTDDYPKTFIRLHVMMAKVVTCINPRLEASRSPSS